MRERGVWGKFTKALRRRIYLLVTVIAAFTVAAGIVALIRPPTYEGTALVFIDERFASSKSLNVTLQGNGSLSDHYIQDVTSQAVLTRACSGMYFDTPGSVGFHCSAGSLISHVSANTVGGADWIAINVTSGSATEAAAFANAVAGAMTDQNKADIDQLVSPSRDYLNSELARLGTQIAAQQATVSSLEAQTTPDQQASLVAARAELSFLQSQYLATDGRIQDLVIQQNWLDGSLKADQAAMPPLNPIDPDPLRYVAIGLAAGLCAGLIAVVLVDRLDDRVFDLEALAIAAGSRLVVPVKARDSASLSNQESNPYTRTRADLLALHPGLSTVIVVAASSRERIGPIGAGLGTAAVKVGQRVLVVDSEAPTHVMKQSGRNGSRLIVVSDPAEAESQTPAGTAATGEPDYDLTIRLTRPPDGEASAASLARTGDVAVVVATAGATRASDVKRTADSLRAAGIKVAAGILSFDSIRDAGASGDVQEPEVEPELYKAASQVKLPIWRGPGA